MMKSLKTVFAGMMIFMLGNLPAFAQGWIQHHSPEISEDSVVFRIHLPNAGTVMLQGSWMDGFAGVEMEKDIEGWWRYAMQRPGPEIYMYTVSADGVQMPDPHNFRVFRDGQSVKSLFWIRGEEEPFVSYDDRSSTLKGSIVKCWYHSSSEGYDKRLSVYLPYGYGQSDRPYPVLYLQHGGGGDEDCWSVMGRAGQIMDYLIEKKMAVPMIVVMPNSMPYHEASADVMIPDEWVEDMRSEEFADGTSYVKSLYSDIIPFVESNFRAVPDKSARAVAGLSMGGIYTLNVTSEHPELFDYIGVLSMGTTPDKEAEAQLLPVKEAGYSLYFVGCGKSDMAWPNAERLMQGLDSLDMEYTYYDSEEGHNWASWRKSLFEMAQLLFR